MIRKLKAIMITVMTIVMDDNDDDEDICPCANDEMVQG
jgi:hypothetical protein